MSSAPGGIAAVDASVDTGASAAVAGAAASAVVTLEGGAGATSVPVSCADASARGALLAQPAIASASRAVIANAPRVLLNRKRLMVGQCKGRERNRFRRRIIRARNRARHRGDMQRAVRR